jgi:endonuclease YncB( thermonuclease family)
MLVALLSFVAFAYDAPKGPPPTSARVVKVYDGDTFTLETGDKIRLKWVNTPELRPKEPYGDQARDYAARLILDQTISLVLDGPNPRDSYGRVLAGVTTPTGKDLSLALLEEGLGHVFIIPPEHHDLSAHLAAQGEARKARRGIWSTTNYLGALHMTSFHANAAGDDNQNVNGEYLRLANITTETVDTAGYRLMDVSGNSWTFPSVKVPAGHTVLVKSGKGSSQDDPRFQLEIFLGSDTPIWNNDHDVATLLDPQGRTIDTRPSK